MPVGDKPILEIIINQLKTGGFDSVILAVGHLHHMIEAHFQDGSKYGLSIEYSIETKRLGTAGPMGLVMDKLSDNFLVMNGDLLTNLDYANLMSFHLRRNAAASIAVQKRTVNIDYGVLDFDTNKQLVDYREKPHLDYFVSMGINAIRKTSIQALVNGEDFFDIPDLMKTLVTNGQSVCCYESECDWLDIGRPDDYHAAMETFEQNPEKFQVSEEK